MPASHSASVFNFIHSKTKFVHGNFRGANTIVGGIIASYAKKLLTVDWEHRHITIHFNPSDPVSQTTRKHQNDCMTALESLQDGWKVEVK